MPIIPPVIACVIDDLPELPWSEMTLDEVLSALGWCIETKPREDTPEPAE